jgi:hypothetical protein
LHLLVYLLECMKMHGPGNIKSSISIFQILFFFTFNDYHTDIDVNSGLSLLILLIYVCIGRRSAAARLLRSWVWIPPGAWMFVCCKCCVLSGRGLCDELITRPEESYRLWCVIVCDLENLKNDEATTRFGSQRHQKICLYRTIPVAMWCKSYVCWDRRFESRWGHRCLSVVFVVRCVGMYFCDGLITHSEESYRLYVPVCDLET